MPIRRNYNHRQMLRPGTKVRLWPWDTHAKYGVVRRADRRTVTVEITWVEPGEAYYQPGDTVVLSRDRLVVLSPEQ